MRFQIGDKVCLLDDVLEGEVISIHKSTIQIKDIDGLVYQFEENELVLKNEEQRSLSKFLDINNDLLKEKTKVSTNKLKLKKDKKEMVLEVDLHIHQLVKSLKGLSSFDILNKQLEVAKSQIEFAIRKKFQKVILIHGVGEGVLKSELSYLLNKYSVTYYEASYQKYGLGATEIVIH